MFFVLIGKWFLIFVNSGIEKWIFLYLYNGMLYGEVNKYIIINGNSMVDFKSIKVIERRWV